MRLYLDSSALIKRYANEPGTGDVRSAMAQTRSWLISRIGYVETLRLLARSRSAAWFRREWPEFDVLELDAAATDRAADIAIKEKLRTLDAIHLATAEIAKSRDLVFASWDKRLWSAAKQRGLQVMPESL